MQHLGLEKVPVVALEVAEGPAASAGCRKMLQMLLCWRVGI